MKQIAAVLGMNFRDLKSRFWPSLVVVFGMACVVGVMLSMMSFGEGMVATFSNAGDPGRALILSLSAQAENGSSLTRNLLPLIVNKPGIARDAAGKPMADGEIFSFALMTRKTDGLPSNMTVRGVGAQSVAMRPKFKLVAGRMFRPGARELIVGHAAQGQFNNTNIGDKIIMQDGEWPIVGVFSMDEDVTESTFWADRDTLMGTAKHPNYNSILVRLTSPAAYDSFRKAVLADPSLPVTVERHSDYYTREQGQLNSFLGAVAFTVGGIMAIGATFGALNTMYAAVGNRARQIATLRALGFSTTPVVLSVLSEALFLTVLGALLGAAFAWICFNGSQTASGASVFRLLISPHLVIIGLIWALVVGLIGGLLPSIRAARLPVAQALRAT